MGWPFIACERCGLEPRFVPWFGNFRTVCGCTPPPVFTSNRTLTPQEQLDMQRALIASSTLVEPLEKP